MSSKQSEQSEEARRHTGPLLDHAHDAAELGDHWFLSATHGVRRASRWARRQLGVIGDSAEAAWQTTARVGSMMVPGGRQGPDAEEPAEGPTEEEPCTGPGWAGVDVRSATPVGEVVERSSGAARAKGRHDEEDAPKLPLLLRLLGHLVSEYGAVGYEALADDARFWRLVSLLQAHNPRKAGKQEPPGRRRRRRSCR